MENESIVILTEQLIQLADMTKSLAQRILIVAKTQNISTSQRTLFDNDVGLRGDEQNMIDALLESENLSERNEVFVKGISQALRIAGKLSKKQYDSLKQTYLGFFSDKE